MRLVLALLLLGAAPAQAREQAGDAFGARYRRAEALYEAGAFAESIRELEAAYAIRPLPRLLLNIGQLHLKLGQAGEALGAYQAFLRREAQRASPAEGGGAKAQPPLIEASPDDEAAAVAQEGIRRARVLLHAEWEALHARALRPPLPALAMAPRPPAPPRTPRRVPIYRRWWFWGGLGLLAAGAATGTALAVTRPWSATAPGDLPVLDYTVRPPRGMH